jgi:hypothetical protein
VLIGLPNFDLIGLQILLPPAGPLGNIFLHLGYVVVGYTYERHGCTLPELIRFSLSIITFSLSRTTVEVSHVDAGEHMVPGPFHSIIQIFSIDSFSLTISERECRTNARVSITTPIS